MTRHTKDCPVSGQGQVPGPQSLDTEFTNFYIFFFSLFAKFFFVRTFSSGRWRFFTINIIFKFWINCRICGLIYIYFTPTPLVYYLYFFYGILRSNVQLLHPLYLLFNLLYLLSYSFRLLVKILLLSVLLFLRYKFLLLPNLNMSHLGFVFRNIIPSFYTVSLLFNSL